MCQLRCVLSVWAIFVLAKHFADKRVIRMRLLEVHIGVSDVDRSVRLYERLLDYKKTIRWDNDRVAALILKDGTSFGIWPKDKLGIHDGRAGTHVHFAFQIAPSEYQQCKAKIESAGLEPLEYQWPSGHRSLYFFDYDGHQAEFMTVDWLGSTR